MLEPEGRQPLLDALKPPPGFVLDRAVGTSYSLDLLALLTAPLAFALFDRISADGEKLDVDPIALLEAVRRHADQMDIFCQAGQVAVMREHRPIVAYLERSVHGVVPPDPNAIFHPKIWLLRYRTGTGDTSYRFLCLSRNLTFDRSWDTLLRLDGEVKDETPSIDTAPLAAFVRSLPGLAVNPLADDRTASINALAEELAQVHFSLPEGFRSARFWPMGHDGTERWPLEGRVDRLLTISPFLTVPMLARLSGRGRNHVLVSRTEALDLVGSNAVAGFGEVLTLSSAAVADPDAELQAAPPDEGIAESPEYQLQGLHAKCYVADAGGDARVWTGSANATGPAFGGNVEFLVELTGAKRLFGVDVTLGERAGQPSLRSILEEYVPSNAEPRELSVAEELDRELDVFRRWLGSHRYEAKVEERDGDRFAVTLRGSGPRARAGTSSPPELLCRPLTTRAAAPVSDDSGIVVAFPSLSFEALTSFYVFTAKIRRDNEQREIEFVVNAELISVTGRKREQKRYYRHSGYPGGLRSRTLAEMLERRPEEVIRKAVKGMLPRNKLGRAQLRKLKVYAGPDHPHEAQKPEPMEVSA